MKESQIKRVWQAQTMRWKKLTALGWYQYVSITQAMEPVPWRGAALCSTLELSSNKGRWAGVGIIVPTQLTACLLGFTQARGLLNCAFRLGHGSWLSFVPMSQMTVQSTHAWGVVGCWKVSHPWTPFFCCWSNSTPTWALTVWPGGLWLRQTA